MRYSSLFAVILALCLMPSRLRADAQFDPEMFGINGCGWSHLGANTDHFDKETGLKRLDLIRHLGATWDRCDFWWARIEPKPGEYDWHDYDWIVDQYVNAGIEVMPILCYGSAWSDHGAAPVTDEERERFGKFVFEIVKRYKGKVHAYEIWNEPNIVPFWTPTPNAEDYAKLLKVAYDQAKKADPTATIVGGAVAGIDYAFVEKILDAGAAKSMDVFSFHPYQGDLGSIGPDAGGLAAQIRKHRELLNSKGFTGPIWITEIGWRTPGGEGTTSVSKEMQAICLVRTYAIARDENIPRVFWFNLQDWEEFWGLVDKDFKTKPAYTTYHELSTRQRGN